MDKVDWTILSSLSDDYESFKQIRFWLLRKYPVTDEEIRNRLISLYRLNYIFFFEDSGSRINDITDDDIGRIILDNTWVGLTDGGGVIWEEKSVEYCGEIVDWDDEIAEHLDYLKSEGFIYARTEQKCKEAFDELVDSNQDIHIDIDSVNINYVEHFRYKYYKTLKDGYKLSFSFSVNDLFTDNKS